MADNSIDVRDSRGSASYFYCVMPRLATETAATHAKWIVPCYGHIVDVIVDADTAPTGADSIVDIHLNGTTIYTTQANRPTLSDGDTGYYSEAAEPEVTAVKPGDVLQLIIDQIGSGTAATELAAVVVIATR